MKIGILISKEDPVASSIFNLINAENKREPVLSNSDFAIYDIEDFIVLVSNSMHLYVNNLEIYLKNYNISTLIFPSKHQSEKGIKSLTVHPIGNFGKNEFGGKEKTLVPSSPVYMYSVLMYLYLHKLNKYNVSYEATHHGPFLTVPSFFVEVGSSPEDWNNIEAHKLILESIMDLRGNTLFPKDVAIGIGGGHYAPRFTDLAIKKGIAFGHIFPAYRFENFSEELGKEIINKTDDVKYVAYHGNIPGNIKTFFDQRLSTVS